MATVYIDPRCPPEVERMVREEAARNGDEVLPTRPFYATEPTEQGNQFVIPGCEKDKSRGPNQMDLF